jgi:hypothetical protein
VTIINIVLEPRRAVVATDSLARLHGELLPFNKLLPVGHFNALVACRGNGGFLAFLYLRICVATTFDQAAVVFPAVLAEAWASFKLHALPRLDAATLSLMAKAGGQEVYFVGWSERAAAMRGWCYEIDAASDRIDAKAIVGNSTAPWHDERLAHLELPTSTEKMLALARAQVRLGRELEPELSCGGRLTIAELTPGRLVISDAGPIDPVSDAGGSPWGPTPSLQQEKKNASRQT